MLTQLRKWCESERYSEWRNGGMLMVAVSHSPQTNYCS